MSDLVKRLRQMDRGYPTILSTAADRIEKLERELANTSEAHMLELEWRLKLGRDVQALRAELAAEKALADRLHKAWATSAVNPKLAEDYRKARGL